mgnify:CR=1 FL=1
MTVSNTEGTMHYHAHDDPNTDPSTDSTTPFALHHTNRENVVLELSPSAQKLLAQL